MTLAADSKKNPEDAPPQRPGEPGVHVLLVDDDATFRRAMAKALGRKGLKVSELSGGAAAIEALRDEHCAADVVVLDLLMPGVSGLQVLRSTPRHRPKVIVLTGHGTVPDAVEAMRLGAFTFLQKPIDADELLPVIQQALAAAPRARDQLIGKSAAMRGLRQVLDNCAQATDPVLLYGETGTGKEVAARYLHQHSRRAAHPLVAINLACLPRELVESELFGHARGAFTGADRRKRGLFAEVGQGTLFLDEVSELPLELQPKLLRTLETRSFRPVGETREEPLQAGLVCATNRDLRALVKKGLFREDLYYRLAVLPVVLPPLREHAEDIVPIAEYWLDKLSRTAKLSDPSAVGPAPARLQLTADAQAALQSHDYPGNVRELVNVVRRLALFAMDGVVDGALVRRMLAEDPFRTLRPEPLPDQRPDQRPAQIEARAAADAAGPMEVRSPAVPQARPQPTTVPAVGPPELPSHLGAAASTADDIGKPGGTSPLASAAGSLIGWTPTNAEPLSLRELEIRHIEKLLREHKNITMVAKLLDIDRRTLQRKLRSLGIDWRDE